MTFEITEDVFGIDLEMFDTEVLAAYVVDGPEPILVEAGYANGIEHLRSEISSVLTSPSELEHLIVSHIHLDHSGCAAALADEADSLRIYIHEKTADLLLDPAPLVESSKRAMGESFEIMGSPAPLDPEHLVRLGDDGLSVRAGERSLELIHTPGHAPDHISVWDPTSGTLFVNEAIGSYYPRADTWLPPSTLPRFDVAAVRESAERLRGFDPDRLALSHFGVVDDTAEAFDRALDRLTTFENRIPELYEVCDRNLPETEKAVRSELLDLGPYDERIQSFEARFQTRGFLRQHGLL